MCLAISLPVPCSPFGVPGLPMVAMKGRNGVLATLIQQPRPLNKLERELSGVGGLAKTAVCPHALLPLLARYPNRATTAYLYLGFTVGFQIPYNGPRVATDSGNLKSVREMPAVVAKKISKECATGSVAGPFSCPPFPNLQVSSLGVVPKKDLGEFRLIHHWSYLKGSSVNDAITSELCSVSYASLDHALSIICTYGPGALLAKCDIQSAFRLLLYTQMISACWALNSKGDGM